MRSSIRAGSLAIAVASCTVTAPAPPPHTAPVVVPTSATTSAPVASPPEVPRLSRDEAIARAEALAEAWKTAPQYDDERLPAWLHEHALDELQVRRVVEAIARPCLEQRDRDGPPCKALGERSEGQTDLVEATLELLAELADPTSIDSPTVRVLVRLSARGFWRADIAIERLLERRMLASAGTCGPPTPDAIENAKRALGDFAVVDKRVATSSGSPNGALVARAPTPRELDDLAYFYAAVADAPPAPLAPMEDLAAKSLPDGHPDLLLRDKLRKDLQDALLDGDLARHARLADAYLRSLGYPGPIRVAEEADQRWGGAGASYLMRDAARSLELLGKYDLAEALYRRSNPGGGACGTSTSSLHDKQIEGAIRTAEQRRGCQSTVPDRLFAVALDIHRAYGPERLARSGYDVARLYAGALLTGGRDDVPELERALRAMPAHANEALTRLMQKGPESWAARVRAVAGYADTTKRGGIDRLVDLAEAGPLTDRVDAIDALGLVAEDHGVDPCDESRIHLGWHHGSSRDERTVRSVMGECATRIDAKSFEDLVRRTSALVTDPDPRVRESVAVALGRFGSPRGRKALAVLERDPFDVGGQVCTSTNGGPQVCQPNHPVALAAREALAAIDKADKTRAEQRAQRKQKAR